ncbi:MAG TPA: hypothetical protein VGM93_04635, partial [Acidimicrobiales bacterium]
LLIVEQQMPRALALCDRVVLLEHGAVDWEGPAADAGQEVAAHVFHDRIPGPGPDAGVEATGS